MGAELERCSDQSSLRPSWTCLLGALLVPAGSGAIAVSETAGSSQLPVENFEIGLPVTGNGRDYVQAVQMGPDGTYLAVIACGGTTTSEAPFGVVAKGFIGIGDSYSSGEGASVFTSDTNTSTNRCHRAETGSAWQRMAAAVFGKGFDFGACSGASRGLHRVQLSQLPGGSSARSCLKAGSDTPGHFLDRRP